MVLAKDRLDELATTLRNQIGSEKPNLSFDVGTAETSLPSGLSLPYSPSTEVYERKLALSINFNFTSNQIEMMMPRARVIVHAHAIGSEFRGLIGIIVLFDTDLALKEPFQVNYAEPYENAERRFRPWLEESLVSALTLWRKSL